MIIKLLVEAGDMKPGPVIGQKLGPIGINIGKVIQEVNKATGNFKGMKVPVELDINPKTKDFSVNVSSPPTAELLKKELASEKGSGASKKIKIGNLAIEQIIKIAKIKYPNMTASNLKASVKSAIGSCVSSGILVENKEAKEIEKEISEGKFDSEIKDEKTEISTEKKAQLADFFTKIKAKQDEMLKKEEEARKEEEAKKVAAPAAGASAVTEKKPETKEEKPESKKEAKK